MSWYYVDQGRQAGPVEDSQLEELRREGRILDDTLVWQEGLPNWIPFREAQPAAPAPPLPLSPVAAPPVAPPTVAPPVQVNPMMGATGHLLEAMCAECGRIFSTDDMIRVGRTHVCATCKPVFIQKLSEGARINPSALQYAGFWIRVVAKIVDRIIILLLVALPFVLFVMLLTSAFRSSTSPSAPLSSVLDRPLDGSLWAAAPPEWVFPVMGILFYLVPIGTEVAYSVFFVGRYGATPGRMLCQLLVVDASGSRIGYGRALGRAFAEILTWMTMGVGYVIVAFDQQKRSLNDHLCNTRVVHK